MSQELDKIRTRIMYGRTSGPDDPRHGTTNGYVNLGCRCERCRTAWRVYIRERRRARIAGEAGEPKVHGTPSNYTNWRCRCDKCSQAWNEYNKGLRARHRTISGT